MLFKDGDWDGVSGLFVVGCCTDCGKVPVPSVFDVGRTPQQSLSIRDISTATHIVRANRRAPIECLMLLKKAVASLPAWTMTVSGDPGCDKINEVIS